MFFTSAALQKHYNLQRFCRSNVFIWVTCFHYQDYRNAFCRGSVARGAGGRRKIRLIEGNAKCRHLQKFTCNGTLRQVSVWGLELHTYSHRGREKGEGGGENWTREKGRGATVHKAGSKISTWLTAYPVYKLWKKPAAKSLLLSIFLGDDILLWCLYG